LENRGVGPDSKGKRQNCDQGKTGAQTEQPEGVTELLPE